jgi:methylenetetrahydrofolate reductase (NADPH)
MSNLHARSQRELLERPRFELVPVKGVRAEIDHLPDGARVPVTCSPVRGIENTLELCGILRQRGYAAVPHIAARLVESEEHAEAIIQRLRELEVGEIFVIGGDVPRPAGPFESSLQLLGVLRTLGYRGDIGIAGYPEPHPLIESELLWKALADKQPYASYIVSQICFDAHQVLAWIDELRGRNVELPLWIGFPGVVDRTKLMRVAIRIGVGDSTRFLTKHGNLVTRLLRPGGYNPNELVAALSPHIMDGRSRVAGFHINTFNQVANTERWRMQLLNELPGSSDNSAAKA